MADDVNMVMMQSVTINGRITAQMDGWFTKWIQYSFLGMHQNQAIEHASEPLMSPI